MADIKEESKIKEEVENVNVVTTKKEGKKKRGRKKSKGPKKPKKPLKPNETTGFFIHSGVQVISIGEADYAQIKLAGPHAEEENAHILVSASMYGEVIKYKWYLGKHGYPVTYQSLDHVEKFGVGVKLHKMLLGYQAWVANGGKKGLVIDHINRDRLDNRLENLRICTPKQNSYNTSRRGGKSKYKGVSPQGKTGKWIASVTKDGKKHEIKDIASERDAAVIYDMMAESLFGDYAGKNFN